MAAKRVILFSLTLLATLCTFFSAFNLEFEEMYGVLASGAIKAAMRARTIHPVATRLATSPLVRSVSTPKKASSPLTRISASAVATNKLNVKRNLVRTHATSVLEKEAEVEKPVEKFRKDYKPPPYWVRTVDLDVKVFEGKSTVTSKLYIERDSTTSEGTPMTLDGEDLTLNSIKIDGKEWGDYKADSKTLTIGGGENLPEKFTLETTVTIEPEFNTQLSGFYKSGSMYCTQCEAEGFRRITYHLDRPDVMAKYRVRLEADKSWPVLLSNGNQIEYGDAGEGRHYAVFEDPFLKPSYLFAMVVGDLGKISDTFTTMSGREVELNVFSERENVDALKHAMDSLKKSMKWDEDRFGREYDLDVYHVVAVNDFNMGAMENKGLNIFNTALTLAKPETATDMDYMRIEGVIGHEYFHNWSGNRVTCRDWFQLTLKEGLTVFRDQEFSADMWSHPVKRIEEVRSLRARQFPEDAGPMSHPIRPESYIAMDNFYTATVYSKGAEVIRMYHTLLGEELFRKGMDLYFSRHDGEAVTCDDFRMAMAEASGRDLTQFERWYTQSGTPTLKAEGSYFPENKTYALTLEQSCAPSAGQAEKLPFHMPVKFGLIGQESGKEIVSSKVLELVEEKQTFEFENIEEKPVPSVLRGFSAPVKLEMGQSDEDLALLLKSDADAFNRWEAGQRLLTRVILKEYETGEKADPPQVLIDAIREVVIGDGDMQLRGNVLALPDLSTLSGDLKIIDPTKLHEARKHVKNSIAKALAGEFRVVYDTLTEKEQATTEYELTAEAVGRRFLRNICLSFLVSSEEDQKEKSKVAYSHYSSAKCMTDKLAGLGELVNIPGEEKNKALESFLEDAKGDALVINKWFAMQATATGGDTLENMASLTSHPEFTLKNPNRVRSLFGVFGGNMPIFHSEDGEGYKFLGKAIIELDALNPQIAARLLGPFGLWKRYDESRQKLMKAQLEKVLETKGLSPDTFEVASRYINA
mmetsp:Transcript_10941/g.16337  ORF Transcript_10941/g.16337 Transcript_10941/m.16337 type:complete len:979 (+) Transcript_10941:26-2962(+)